MSLFSRLMAQNTGIFLNNKKENLIVSEYTLIRVWKHNSPNYIHKLSCSPACLSSYVYRYSKICPLS